MHQDREIRQESYLATSKKKSMSPENSPFRNPSPKKESHETKREIYLQQYQEA